MVRFTTIWICALSYLFCRPTLAVVQRPTGAVIQTLPKKRAFLPGLTPASLLASLFALLLTGMLVQYAEIVVGIAFPAEHTLAVPAIWAFLVVALVQRVVRPAGRGPRLSIVAEARAQANATIPFRFMG